MLTRTIMSVLFLNIVLHTQVKQLDEAVTLMFNNEYEKAIGVLEESLEQKESISDFLKLGLCYKNLYLNNKALSAFEAAYKLDSNNTDVLTNLASAYSTTGYNNEAIKSFRDAHSINPENKYVLINLAKLLVENGSFNEAEVILKDLIHKDSTSNYYHKQLGYIYQKRGLESLAKEHYEKALKLNGEDIFVISNLSRIYFNSQMPDSALALLDKGLESFHANPKLLKIKADILFSEEKYSGAVNAFVKILASGGETAQIYQRLGVCYYQIALENFVGDAQIKKLESAKETLLKSFRIDSTQSLTALYIGMAYKELNRNEAALKYLNKSLELIYPKFTSAIYTNLALVNQRAGNYADAIKNFKEAQKVDSENSNYWYYLASIYDLYYNDKSVPMIYYQKYLLSEDSSNSRLSNYAASRIEQLREKVHFQNGKL